MAKFDSVLGYSTMVSNSRNAVLGYHTVGNPGCYGNISEAKFRRQIEFLQERYKIVDLPEVLNEPESGEKRIALTFDDGFHDFYTNVVPIIEEFGVPVTVFLSPNLIDDSKIMRIQDAHNIQKHGSNIMMTSDQIEYLSNHNLVSLGNHTLDHHDLSEVEEQHEIEHQILDSKTRLEDAFDISVNRFSFPYGGVDNRSLELVRRSHKFAVTSEPDLLCSNTAPCQIPRISAHISTPEFQWELTDLSSKVRAINSELF